MLVHPRLPAAGEPDDDAGDEPPSTSPATASTVYEIGSITKQFTAEAVMQLVAAHKIELDAAIARYLPAVPAAGRRSRCAIC